MNSQTVNAGYKDLVLPDSNDLIQDGSLATWWMDTASADCIGAVEKSHEYGAADLTIMGEAMDRLVPTDEPAGVEKAIAFYLLGKISRLVGAYEKGRQPSDDSWKDITVYSMMARRVRETKRWP